MDSRLFGADTNQLLRWTSGKNARFQRWLTHLLGISEWSFGSPILFVVTFIGATLREEFGITEMQVAALSSAPFLGWTATSLFWSMASDTFGRRIVVVLSYFLASMSSFLCAFSPNFTLLLIGLLSYGVCYGGTSSSTYVLIVEFMPDFLRGWGTSTLTNYWPVGLTFLTFLAWSLPTWRYLFLVIAVLQFVSVIFIFLLLPESPRFLELQGRDDELLAVMERVARFNRAVLPHEKFNIAKLRGLVVPKPNGKPNGKRVSKIRVFASPNPEITLPETLKSNKNNADTIDSNASTIAEYPPVDSIFDLESPPVKLNNFLETRAPTNTVSENYTDLEIGQGNLKKPQLVKIQSRTWDVFLPSIVLRTITMYVIWFACSLVYYGLSMSSSSMSGSIYANFILLAVVEVPGYSFGSKIADMFGRRKAGVLFFFISGVALAIAALPIEIDGSIITVLAVLGKLGISGAFIVAYIFTAEVFPTSIRSIGMGSCSTMSRAGATAAPLVVNLLDNKMSLAVFAFSALVSCFLVFSLRETKDKPLESFLPEQRRRALSKIQLQVGLTSTNKCVKVTSVVPITCTHT